ncbi:Ribosomal protein S5 domain 2-type fold [Phytophthora cactorum]|nr:Ribosomal protein S5 domain 2-type fold [Phytophthora cactorum]
MTANAERDLTLYFKLKLAVTAQSSMANLRPTCVSAPGKVLLVGGYVVLDEQYSGLVLSSTARFYSQVETKILGDVDATSAFSSGWGRLFPLVVESKQFDQLIDGWIEENGDGRFRFQLRENSHRNSYIEETVLCAVNGIAGLLAFKTLKAIKTGVQVTLRGDNDFYSQVQRAFVSFGGVNVGFGCIVARCQVALRRANLKALEAFLPPTMEERDGKQVALKTGMGSSAALVTSLVAALVAFFVPAMNFDEVQQDLEVVHNLAQLSHCYVQRKKPVRLPSSFHLLMGDVSSGSATVSLVRQVLKWQKEQPEEAKRVMDEIHYHNLEVERGFAEICELEASHNTFIDWEAMAAQGREQWKAVDARIGAILLRLSEAFSRFRDLMREMGTSAGVPIEPPEQTAILDATLAIPGVLLAGVPGAGGYDAICVVVIHEHALRAVEDLWVQWPTTNPNSICPRSPVRGHTSNMSKRKFRDVGDAERDTQTKVSRNNAQVGRVETSEQEPNGRFSVPGLRFATESWTGLKTSNEDRHVSSVEFFPGPVFGIFDGHGGTFSADFLSRHLVKTVASVVRQSIGGKALANLEHSQEESNQEKSRKDAIAEQVKLLRQQLAELETLKDPDSESSADDIQVLVDQLTDTISQLNSEVAQIDADQAARREERREWCREQHGHILKSLKDAFERVDSQLLQKNPSQDGSTALLVWFLADTARFGDEEDSESLTDEVSFYTVNVGDCRAVMCRGGRGVALTSDHKPDRPDEQQRIERAGGFVGKIAGISRVYSAAGAGLAMERETSTYLAVSRAFGDRSLKTPTPLVSCEPEVKRMSVQNDDLFLVLACDGVWDVLSEQDAVDIALPHFHDAKAAAGAIVKAAYKKGSVDNLTATVIQFGWKSDGQLQQALKTSRASTPKGRNGAALEAEDEEEIDMFNL